MWIDQIIIDKDNRCLGYGKMLIQSVKQIAKENECKRIEFCCWSFNKNAMEMYKHICCSEQRVIFEIDL